MSPLAQAVLAPPAGGFKPGAVALRIRRGNMFFLLPRPWVRGMRELHAGACTPLPRAKRWVLGIVEESSLPLPLLDPAASLGATAAAPTAACRPRRARPRALRPRRGRRARPLRLHPGPPSSNRSPAGSAVSTAALKSTWWLETGRLSAELEG
jgi:hypothetical protein